MKRTLHLHFYRYALVILIMTSTVAHCLAGGFPVRPGRLNVSPTFSYFAANSIWDANGVKSDFQKNGKFTAISTALYLEYGISRRWAITATLPYGFNKYEQTGFSQPYSGLGDIEGSVKYYLANIDYKYYFSLQATGIISTSKDGNLSYGDHGAELKLSFGTTGKLANLNYYLNIDNAVRQYFSNSGPLQYRGSGAFGLILDKKLENQLSFTGSGFYSTSNNKRFNLQNPLNNRNFSFIQAGLGYGHTFDKKFTVFVTGGHFITGRNTADGGSMSLSFIYRIDTR